jgi:hypothetical protein
MAASAAFPAPERRTRPSKISCRCCFSGATKWAADASSLIEQIQRSPGKIKPIRRYI